MRSSPLAGRTVVVTGAARGLGAAMAREAACRGARVALLGHERLAPGGRRHGPRRSGGGGARTVRQSLGRPSAVVANAGIAKGGPFADSDPPTWQRVIDVNLTGSAHTARAHVPAPARRVYPVDMVATRLITAWSDVVRPCTRRPGYG